MSDDKHTPGPWKWQVYDHSMASLGVGDKLGDPLVLTIAPCAACAERADPKEWVWGRCITPNEADARLIAAAPDLLAALIDLHDDCVEYCRINNIFNDDGKPGSNHAMRRAKEAIAKAKENT